MVAKNHRIDTKRLTAFYVAAFLFMLILVARLIQIQIVQREKFSMLADVQYKCEVKLPPERGKIFDRNLNKLATNVPAFSVIAHPSQIKEPETAARQIADVLKTRFYLISQKLQTNSDFVYLARQVSKSTSERIEELGISGITCQLEMGRKYPKNETGAQLLGFTDIDGEGLSGIELSCESILRGRPGKAILQRTGRQKLFRRTEYPIIPPENGLDLVLTIDYAIQSIVERELRKIIVESNADKGSVVVMNPQTGEVIAIASEPNFDPNNPGKYHPSTWRLQAITDQFEPGSTFKLVLFSAVMNEQLRKPEDLVFCENGKYNIMGETIHDNSPHAWLSLRDVLVKSSNIGMAKTALEVNKSILYQYARDFGFGKKSEIELKGEVNGVLKPVIEWSGYTPVAMAIGHEVAVTPLQVCNMFSTIANGGLLLRPYIIKAIKDGKTGAVIQKGTRKVTRRVIDRSTAEIVAGIMQEVVERGTAQHARIPSLNICGKTGTARMVKQGHIGYRPNEYIASFGGFFPKEDPQYCIFVMVENPKGKYHGGEVAAPCFKRITEQIIALEGIGNDIDEPGQMAELFDMNDKQRAPQYIGFKKAVAEKMAGMTQYEVETMGSGKIVLDQQPQPGEIIHPGEKVILNTKAQVAGALTATEIPSVIGLPIRNALNILTSSHIKVVVVGTGRVVKQQPAPGNAINPNEQVLLHCESSIDLKKLLIL